MYNINRRKFLSFFGCSCCSLILPSCSTVPITDRKQLTLIPESKINSQAAAAYEQFRSKAKIINKGTQLNEVIKIGKKIESAVSAFFTSQGEEDPTKNFGWDYILVDNDKASFYNAFSRIINEEYDSKIIKGYVKSNYDWSIIADRFLVSIKNK